MNMCRLIYLLAILLFISCNVGDKKVELVTVDFSGESTLPASDLLSVSYVKLETNDSCMLGVVSQCIEMGGRYFLLDNMMAKTLYVFGSGGHFLQQIGKKGNGPGEYVTPFAFAVNEREKTLSVIDIEQQKLIFYSLDDFSFLSEKKLPFYSDKMEQLTNGDYVWYNKMASDASNSYVFITDGNFKVKKNFLPIDFESGYSIGTTRKLYKQGDEVTLYTPFSPVLYRVESDSLLPAYQFRFGDDTLAPIDFLKEKAANNSNYIPALMESHYVAFYEVYESERLLCVPYYVDKQMYFGFYDKMNHTSYLFTQDKIQTDLQVGAFSSPIGVSSEGGFISLLRPGILLQLMEQGKNLDDNLVKLLKESTEEDNPILLLCSMKK